MRTARGRLPVADSVEKWVVPHVVTSVSPAAMNAAGGVATFYGANFPSNLADFPGMKVWWADGTPCYPRWSNSTMLVCSYPAFSVEVRSAAAAEGANGGGGRRRDLEDDRRDLFGGGWSLSDIAASMGFDFTDGT